MYKALAAVRRATSRYDHQMTKDPFNLWKWLGGPLVLTGLYMALGWFDTSSELTPNHDDVLNLCFVLGGLGSLALGYVAISSRQQMKLVPRIYFALCMALLGFLSVFLLSSRIADLALKEHDFPKKSTSSFTGDLLIRRAYTTHGRFQSWNIQTMPLWSDLSITEGDYRFMLEHRRPGESTTNQAEISSEGYFCAHVAMQQSGQALRVLHAGSSPLPAGSVVLCPTSR